MQGLCSLSKRVYEFVMSDAHSAAQTYLLRVQYRSRSHCSRCIIRPTRATRMTRLFSCTATYCPAHRRCDRELRAQSVERVELVERRCLHTSSRISTYGAVENGSGSFSLRPGFPTKTFVWILKSGRN
jgi:hypothetical protein